MNKKMRRMEAVLGLGSFIILLAGVWLIFSKSVESDALKIIGLLGVSVIEFVLAIVSGDMLKLKSSSKAITTFGCLGILGAYLYIGFQEMLGPVFSAYGTANALYFATVAFLIALLFVLMAVRFKEFNYIYFSIVASVVGIYSMLRHFSIGYEEILIGLVILTLIFSIVKVNDKSSTSSTIFTYLLSIVSCYVFFMGDAILNGILIGIVLINILVNMFKYKDNKGIKISLVVLSFVTLLCNEFSSLYLGLDLNNFLLVSIFILCVYDLIMNYINILNSDGIKILYKVFMNSSLLLIFGLGVLSDAAIFTLLVMSLFISVTSLINSFVIKKNDYEYYLFAFKLYILSLTLLLFVSDDIITIDIGIIHAIINLIFLGLYSAVKEGAIKKECLSIIVFTLICIMITSLDFNLISYIASLIAIVIDYLVVVELKEKGNSGYGKLFYTFSIIILMTLINNEELGALRFLLLSLVLASSLYLNRNNKYNYGITVPLFYLMVMGYINSIFDDALIQTILNSTFYFISVLLFAFNMFNKDGDRSAFISAFSVICLFYLFVADLGVILVIYNIVISIILILIGLYNKSYKPLYIIGIVSVIISLVSVFRYIGGLPVAVYLFLIGLILVIVIIVMIIKYQNKLKENPNLDEDKKVVPQTNTINFGYCGECGHKLEGFNSFCPECGSKLKKEINFCGQCGNRIKPDAKFCGKCGDKIN